MDPLIRNKLLKIKKINVEQASSFYIPRFYIKGPKKSLCPTRIRYAIFHLRKFSNYVDRVVGEIVCLLDA